MKKCTKCKEFLSESMFNKSNRNKNGLRAECRICQCKEAKRYSENPIVKSMKSAYRQVIEHKDVYRKNDKKRNATEKRKLYKSSSNSFYWTQKKAHDAVYQAILSGKLIRGQCEYQNLGDCTGQPQGHHEDYNKPLDVRWLCPVHHKKVHLLILK